MKEVKELMGLGKNYKVERIEEIKKNNLIYKNIYIDFNSNKKSGIRI